MVLRNSVYNLLGLGLPLVVAVVAIPALIHSLGAEQFGILTIIWAVVSYFGLFDLGLGRVVTQQIAIAIAEDDSDGLKVVVGTSSVLMASLGIVGGIAMAMSAPLLAHEFTKTADPAAVTRAFYWMAAAMPAIPIPKSASIAASSTASCTARRSSGWDRPASAPTINSSGTRKTTTASP